MGIDIERQNCQIYFGLLEWCSANVMINSKVVLHGWKTTPNHWQPTKKTSRMHVWEGWLPTYKIGGPMDWELTIHMGGMQRINVRNIC